MAILIVDIIKQHHYLAFIYFMVVSAALKTLLGI